MVKKQNIVKSSEFSAEGFLDLALARKQVPKRRQTLMFSATWPEEVQTLAHDFLKDCEVAGSPT